MSQIEISAFILPWIEFCFMLIGSFIFLCCVIRLCCFEVALVGWGGSRKDLVNGGDPLLAGEETSFAVEREVDFPSFHISCVVMMPLLSWSLQED